MSGWIPTAKRITSVWHKSIGIFVQKLFRFLPVFRGESFSRLRTQMAPAHRLDPEISESSQACKQNDRYKNTDQNDFCLFHFSGIASRSRFPDAWLNGSKKSPGQFPNRGAFYERSFKKAFTMNRSAGDGFSAADIAEAEAEESGDQGNRKPAGKRTAKSHSIETERNFFAIS